MQQGIVIAIHIAETASSDMETLPEIRAIVGQGLEGDRYATAKGSFSSPEHEPDQDVTLIGVEALEALAADGIDLRSDQTRRNIVTRGIDLNALVGHRFRVGEVELLGHKLCEPCRHLSERFGQDLIGPLLHRGGLQAEIVAGGDIRVGDAIVPELGG